MITLYIGLGWLVFMIVVFEVIGRVIFGKFIEEKDLDAYLLKYLSEYKLNDCDDPGRNQMFSNYELPYISVHTTFMSRWYIEKLGRIRRWSKWTKIINEYHAKLEKESTYKKPTISDFM